MSTFSGLGHSVGGLVVTGAVVHRIGKALPKKKIMAFKKPRKIGQRGFIKPPSFKLSKWESRWY